MLRRRPEADGAVLRWPVRVVCASSGVEALSQAGVAQSPGIYLWTSPTPSGELVFYVGETARTFARRMDEHLSEQHSGRYAIYEPEAFALGRRQLLWRGVYGLGAESSVEGFVSRLPALAPAVVQFVRAMRFHVAPISTSDRIRRRIEAALAGHLDAQDGVVGQFQESDVRHSPRFENEDPVEVHCTWQARPLGVPDMLEA
jgi:hypothetical protein